MNNPEWFKVDCIHPILDGFKEETSEEDMEDPILKSIRLRQLDIENEGFDVSSVYINLILDPIINLLPVTVIPRGVNSKKRYTDIVTEKGTVVRAIGGSDEIYSRLIKQIENK